MLKMREVMIILAIIGRDLMVQPGSTDDFGCPIL